MAATKGVFGELGVSGLSQWDGYIQRDPDIALRGASGVGQFDLMRLDDPTAAATLAALSLPIRQAAWDVSPGGPTAGDRKAADFVRSALFSWMNETWDDVLCDVCTMFPFGWSYLEWVLHRVEEGVAFRKLAPRGQATLDRWELDEAGGVQGLWQTSDAGGSVLIPIEKALLFRTTREGNNPEGMSILRSAYRDWRYKRTLERIEAVGLQRALEGVPVVHLGPNATTAEQVAVGSDEEHAREIITRVYANKALGVIEHEDLTFRFEVPKLQGATQDSDRVIRRKDEGIVRATLAMYILLGSKEVGSWALSRELGDLFFMSVRGYLDGICDTMNRYGIPVLAKYNPWMASAAPPALTAEINRAVDLAAVADYISKLIGGQAITPDPALEAHLRTVGGLPPAEATPPRGPIGQGADVADVADVDEGLDEGVDEGQDKGEATVAARAPEAFAVSPGTGVARYVASLAADYTGWVEGTAADLAGLPADVDRRGFVARVDDRIAVGLLLLRQRGWIDLPVAYALGFGTPALGPYQRLAVDQEIATNDTYLGGLFQDIRGTLEGWVDAVLLLVRGGRVDDAEATLTSLLQAYDYRVRLYGGQWWHSRSRGVADAALLREQAGDIRPVTWVLDDLARHCDMCPGFAGTYPSMMELLAATGGILPGQGTLCDGNCRCVVS